MYKFYIVPDATECNSHSELYGQMKLFYDPYAESDSYAVINPKTKEELNTSGTLEFTILPSNIHYNDFHKRKTMVIVYDEDEWIYEGVVADAPVDSFKQRSVTCSGPLAFLADSIQAPDERNEITAPSSSGTTRYVRVPDAWLAGASPSGLNWCTRSKNASGKFVYTLSTDDVVDPDKKYYYPYTSDGDNHSGATITRSAATEETITAHITRLLDVHNSQVNPFKRIYPGRMRSVNDTAVREFKSSGYRNTWDALKSDIIDVYGGYFTITIGNDNLVYLNYLALDQLPGNHEPLIEYANNMISIDETDGKSDDIFTVLIPIGNDNLTVSGASGHGSAEHPNREISPYIVSFGGNRRYVVVGPKAVERYGYIIKTETFGDVDDPNVLYSRAVDYIQNNYDYHPEYNVKAIDPAFINKTGRRINIGDICRVHSKWHGVDVNDLYVMSMERDLASPENDSYRIGVPTVDRESKNRKLSRQTRDSQSRERASAAAASSSSSRTHSILEDYIHVTEDGLEMSSKLKNELETEYGKYSTKFSQTETDINLSAQKLFGIGDEGYGDPDSGYVQVLKSDYKNPNGTLKNPSKEVWFEKEGGKYKPSTDTTADLSKDYYTQRLWARYSDFDVGPGGICAKVDGNYERSTYCSSWIKAKEDEIIAITGHVHIDDDGQVIIDAGGGMRTGYTQEKTDVHYAPVQRSLYGNSPVGKSWYEHVIENNRWTGEGVDESVIMDGAKPNVFGKNESKYYRLSTDTVADRSKSYYVRQTSKEEFVAEYGVYDENTLRGGVVARMINMPQFIPVALDQVAAADGDLVSTHGWCVYDYSVKEIVDPLPDEKVNGGLRHKYFKRVNTAQYETDIWGEHVIIGKHINYDGMDPSLKRKVEAYIANNHLDGTITEIASDVVVVNALFARFVHFDTAEGDYLETGGGRFGWLEINSSYSDNGTTGIFVGNDDGTGYTTYIGEGEVETRVLESDIIQFQSFVFSEEEIGSYDGLPAVDPTNIIVGFDAPSYSGDSGNIKYKNAGMSDFDNSHVLSFTNPASLGSVTWSSGSDGGVLTAKTVGGTDFLVGSIGPYSPGGEQEASQMVNCPYLKSETSGYSTVYGISYTAKGANNSSIAKKTMLFKTPKDRYPDGYSTAVGTVKTVCGSDKTDGAVVSLGINGAITVKARYTNISGSNVDLSGITVWSPAFRIHANYNSTDYGYNKTITLDYGDSVDVYAQYKYHEGMNDYGNYQKITVKSKGSDYVAPSASKISLDNVDVKISRPGSSYAFLDWASIIASAEGHYLTFEANYSGADGPKLFAIDLT